MGVLSYIEVFDETLLPTQSHQRKGKKEVFKIRNQQILHQQTIEIKQLKEKATFNFNYRSSQTAEFHPLIRAFRAHSTLQP